jgi:xanthine dehydrogenase small subunit
MPIRFLLNDAPIEITESAPTLTLLRWLRDVRHLMGTKEGCAEGDCGACTVGVIEHGRMRGECACLLLLPMLQGKRVYTVEGLADRETPHVVQQTLASCLGSQCGYCTPGVTMALFEACYRDDFDEAWKIDAAMCGNLCRCTGYRPIRDAANAVAGLRPADRFSAAIAASKAPPDMRLAYARGSQLYFTPASFDELFDVLDRHPSARFVAGGTDLSLEITKRYQEPPILVSLEALEPLRALEATERGFRLGAGAFLSDVESFARFSLPPLERMLRYFGSRQIKNRATIGGNLCTASPIGDLAPVFLALDATVVLRSRDGERRMPIEDFFVSYRKTALSANEILASVEVPRPSAEARIASYKVSKRRELDISTVAACFNVSTDAAGKVDRVRLGYGGMAAKPARAKKAEALIFGAPWCEDTVVRAADALATDFQPISDHRGSAWYRAEVAKNLLRGFFFETKMVSMPRLSHRHAATVEVS